jgi:hypothetical protein
MCGAILPLPQYIFMAWCLIKQNIHFIFISDLRNFTNVITYQRSQHLMLLEMLVDTPYLSNNSHLHFVFLSYISESHKLCKKFVRCLFKIKLNSFSDVAFQIHHLLFKVHWETLLNTITDNMVFTLCIHLLHLTNISSIIISVTVVDHFLILFQPTHYVSNGTCLVLLAYWW